MSERFLPNNELLFVTIFQLRYSRLLVGKIKRLAIKPAKLENNIRQVPRVNTFLMTPLPVVSAGHSDITPHH